jgi:hypothetical protein
MPGPDPVRASTLCEPAKNLSRLVRALNPGSFEPVLGPSALGLGPHRPQTGSSPGLGQGLLIGRVAVRITNSVLQIEPGPAAKIFVFLLFSRSNCPPVPWD